MENDLPGEPAERYRLLLDSVTDFAVFLLDARGGVAEWGRGAEALLGWTAEEAVGRDAAFIFTPEDEERGERTREVETARREGRAADVRWHVRKDGSRFFCEGSLTALRDGEGGAVRGFVKVMRDVTERRALQDRLNASESDLRREQAYLQAVLDQMPSGLALAEAPSGRLLLHNASAIRLLRHPMLTAQDYTGYRQYGALHPDGTPYEPEEYPIARALWGESVHQEEMRYRRGDGTMAWLSVNAAPVRDAAGNVIASVSTFQDVTARREAEERLRAAYDRDHRIAELLQQALLLAPSLETLPGVRVAPFYEPALDEALVGGDFYDAFPIDGGRVALVVGDASGKGVEAAARTAEVKYAVRAFLAEFPYLARTLTRVNEFLCQAQRLQGGDAPGFVALGMAVLDPVSGEALVSLAGLEPPLVVRGPRPGSGQECGEVTPVGEPGLPLGIDPAAEYEVTSVRLTPRDTLLLATDGVTEARDPKTRQFLGYDGFADLAGSACREPDLGAMGRTVLEGARAFGGGRLRDDVCLLLARLR